MMSWMWSMYSCFSASGFVSSYRSMHSPPYRSAIPKSMNIACPMKKLYQLHFRNEGRQAGHSTRKNYRPILDAIEEVLQQWRKSAQIVPLRRPEITLGACGTKAQREGEEGPPGSEKQGPLLLSLSLAA
jgi:hypothetical protein